jgi:hypothetical protein
MSQYIKVNSALAERLVCADRRGRFGTGWVHIGGRSIRHGFDADAPQHLTDQTSVAPPTRHLVQAETLRESFLD